MSVTRDRIESSGKRRPARLAKRLKRHIPIVTSLIVLTMNANCFAQSSRLKPAAMKNGANQRQKVANDVDSANPSFSVVKTGAVIYRSEDDFQLKCDLYSPQSAADPQVRPDKTFPAIIAIHGGAWSSGSKVTMLRHAHAFARAGYVVMAINYRHAPKYRHPAQIHDCKFAVRWLKSNSSTWHVDPERIGVFGYSAGGHLAALIGTTDDGDGLEGEVPVELQDHDSTVACVAAGGAPCEFSWIGETSNVIKPWLGETRSKDPELYERASPLSYADSDDVPFYFFHGQYDLVVPVDSSLKLHNALSEAGIQSTHELALLTGHVATFSNLTWAEKSLRFFNQHLKEKSTSDKRSVAGREDP